MLEQVLETCKYVVENSKSVIINYKKADELIEELKSFDNVHYLTKVPYDIMGMSIKNIIDFLLVYDSINFSFWGNPKWAIEVNGKQIDGSVALLHPIFNLFYGKESEEVFEYLEKITLEDFSLILKGNVEIPLLRERYKIINGIAKIVNKKMNGSFYSYIKGITNDKQLFETIVSNFASFQDTRIYNGKCIYFYKLAQLLTSDILHILELKEGTIVDYSNLIGCADYKIPQVMRAFGILEYSDRLSNLIESKCEIEENSKYEVEIRASMIIVVNYIWERINKSIDRIDINDFIWYKGQDKNKEYKLYHLTRTTSY